jgi:hypothetical protein
MVSMLSRLPKLLTAASLALISACAFAQVAELQTPLAMRPVPAPKGMKLEQAHDRVFFNTNIGSFKLMGANEVPAEGILDMKFRGTLLVSNLEPGSTIVITGNIRKEVDDKKYKRQVFFGTGRITIHGKFRSVQFFGNALRAAFDGYGYARLYGEFDRNLETGYYWYASQNQKMPWNSQGSQMPVPPSGAVKPQIKIEGKGG